MWWHADGRRRECGHGVSRLGEYSQVYRNHKMSEVVGYFPFEGQYRSSTRLHSLQYGSSSLRSRIFSTTLADFIKILMFSFRMQSPNITLSTSASTFAFLRHAASTHPCWVRRCPRTQYHAPAARTSYTKYSFYRLPSSDLSSLWLNVKFILEFVTLLHY